MHDTIQVAMGWRDSHLHEFSETNPFEPRQPLPRIGRAPLRWTMESSYDEEPGMPEAEWTIARAFAEMSGPLYYEYDFGDGWTHLIEVVESAPDEAINGRALLVRGERRAPLEDSGGLGGYRELLEALEDPTHPSRESLREWIADTLGPWEDFNPDALDIEKVNRELALRFDQAPDAVEPAHSPFADLLERLPPSLQRELRGYAHRVGALEQPTVDAATAARMVEPFAWLMRRVGTEGLMLTKAGWLPPAVVSDAARELGWEDRWFGKMNREDQTMPILKLRENAQRLGLLRKVKGRLVLSVAAKRMIDDPVAPWHFLAVACARRHRIESEENATALRALEVVSRRHDALTGYLEPVAWGLDALGWVRADGRPLTDSDASDLIRDSRDVMVALSVFEMERWRIGRVTDGGRAFAQAVLQA